MKPDRQWKREQWAVRRQFCNTFDDLMRVLSFFQERRLTWIAYTDLYGWIVEFPKVGEIALDSEGELRARVFGEIEYDHSL